MTGNQFKQRRELSGYSQRALAKELGMTQTAPYKWEQKGDDELDIAPKHWHRLAEMLRCDPMEFAPPEERAKKDGDLAIAVRALTKKPTTKVTATKITGSTAVIAGRDAQNTSNYEGFHLSPHEKNLIELVREYGNDKILKKFLKMMLEMKAIMD